MRALLLFFISSFVSAHAYEAEKGFEFSSLTAKSSNDVRVVWWNIFQAGKLGKEIEAKEGHDPLQENLKSLTDPGQKPEFLALGEYRPNEIKPEIDQLLKSRYRFSHFVRYSNTYTYQGIMIFSDLPMKTIEVPISWVDITASAQEQKEYREQWKKLYPSSETSFDRTLIAVQYSWQGKTRYLLPFHSVQPWMPIQLSYPERWAKYLTALEIITGRHNPLYHQLTEYLVKMKKICNPAQNSVVIIGDLNMPDQIKGIPTVGYQLLTFWMKDAFRWNRTHTFPTPSSANDLPKNEVRIDHALVSRSVEVTESKRLPLRGSDHFPIEITY